MAPRNINRAPAPLCGHGLLTLRVDVRTTTTTTATTATTTTTTTTTRRHQAHPASVPILRPRDTSPVVT